MSGLLCNQNRSSLAGVCFLVVENKDNSPSTSDFPDSAIIYNGWEVIRARSCRQHQPTASFTTGTSESILLHPPRPGSPHQFSNKNEPIKRLFCVPSRSWDAAEAKAWPWSQHIFLGSLTILQHNWLLLPYPVVTGFDTTQEWLCDFWLDSRWITVTLNTYYNMKRWLKKKEKNVYIA